MKEIVERAIEVAAQAHRHQVRKGSDIPYIVHPFTVGMLLQEAQCSEEVIVAGILHDTVEDTALTREEIEARFGERVAAIVWGCTEPDKALPWEERKRASIARLGAASREVCLVACADKLHNIRSMARDHGELGEAFWSRFKHGREHQEWHYRAVASALAERGDLEGHPLLERLQEAIDGLFGEGR